MSANRSSFIIQRNKYIPEKQIYSRETNIFKIYFRVTNISKTEIPEEINFKMWRFWIFPNIFSMSTVVGNDFNILGENFLGISIIGKYLIQFQLYDLIYFNIIFTCAVSTAIEFSKSIFTRAGGSIEFITTTIFSHAVADLTTWRKKEE